MKVETPSGDFLVHKGNEFGGSGGNTVVTPASDMSSAWKESGTYSLPPSLLLLHHLVPSPNTLLKVLGKMSQELKCRTM